MRCYHCGNGLRNWEKDDDHWESHAFWFPKCTFVCLTKGQEFVDKVRIAFNFKFSGVPLCASVLERPV